MAREWFGRDERAARADTDPISDEAESEQDDKPTEVRAEPEPDSLEPEAPDERPASATGATSRAERLGALTRRGLAGLGAAAIARLPAVRAAMLLRLP
jgi:apolipoprotein N-acyltransferase